MLSKLSFVWFVGGLLLMGSGVFADEEISYDDGRVQHYRPYSVGCPSCFPYYGVRFTPQSNCIVKKARVYTAIQSGSPMVCSLLVYGADGHSPQTRSTQATFTPSSNGWVNVTINDQPTYNGDFFLIVSLYPNGKIGIGEDDPLDYPERSVCSNNLSSWYYMNDLGDLMIRAVVAYVGAEETETELTGTGFQPVFPNPTYNECTISYTLARSSHVVLKIFDVSGKEVKTLLQTTQQAGPRQLQWDSRNDYGERVSPGVYFCNLTTDGSRSLTRRVVVLSR